MWPSSSLEDRGIEVHGLFGFMVEPEGWSDFVEGMIPSGKAGGMDVSALMP
jgi:hypothetical protein